MPRPEQSPDLQSQFPVGQLSEDVTASRPATVPVPNPVPPCGLFEYTDAEIEPHMLAAHRDSLSPSTQGGFGSVFEADLHGIGKVVVKLFVHMLDSGSSSVSRGLSILQQMRHPHVPLLRGLIRRKQDGDVIGLVLGRFPYTLDAIGGACGFNQLAATPLEVKARILADAVSALAHLHEHGFIHRDVKPLNILVDAGHCGYLNDFDCVIHASTCKLHAEMCKMLAATKVPAGNTGTFLEALEGIGLAGTRYYRPPEGQWGSTVAHSFAFNVYGVGATLMYILEGGLETLVELDKSYNGTVLPAGKGAGLAGSTRLSGPPAQVSTEQLRSRLVAAGVRFHYPAGSAPDARQQALFEGLSKLAVSHATRPRA